MNDDERQQMIVAVLAPRSEGFADSAAIAGRALWSWEQVALQLTPLIGETGFQSLYARAVHLTIPHCAGLVPVMQFQSVDALLQKLKKNIETLPPADAAHVSNLLLDTFTELLATLIGESLTSRILRSAWTAGSGDGNAQEIKK
jgi:hypothetical protein